MPITTAALKPPKYVVLADHLRLQIEQGLLKPGDRLPTFVELSAEFGVTPTTVGRTYAQLEQEGLIVRERGRGTFVMQPVQRQATGLVGIAGIPSSVVQSHPYWIPIMESVREVAGAAGLEFLLLSEETGSKWDRVDGVLSFSLSYSREALKGLPPGMPCVSLLEMGENMINVLADEAQGITQTVRHLVGLGHRRIAYLFDPNSAVRVRAYNDALHAAGIAPEDSWISSLQIYEQRRADYLHLGHAAMGRWIEQGWGDLNCSALMVHNDDAAIGAIRALRQAGFSVPQQVSVTGFDGTEIGRYFEPALTSVQVPLRELGITAMGFLVRQIRGEDVRISTTSLPTSLLLGESTQPLVG